MKVLCVKGKREGSDDDDEEEVWKMLIHEVGMVSGRPT